MDSNGEMNGMQKEKEIQPRKLREEEHIRTRELWEEIFTEDTSEFLDYYYSVKTQENEIYVIEIGNEIVSMLHLNPYQMRVQDKIYQTHYIVAVATKKEYRKQGLMRMLLEYAMQIMKDRGEPFTFLMPAAEAIYKPFGFRFIYKQSFGKIKGKNMPNGNCEIVSATEKECGNIAEYANKKLQEYDIVTWRNDEYYKTMLSELASENGGILIAKQEEKIVGVFCYAYHNGQKQQLIIREPLFEQAENLQYAIYHLIGNSTDEVRCIGYGLESKPMIMAKVLNQEFQLDLKNVKVFLNEVV